MAPKNQESEKKRKEKCTSVHALSPKKKNSKPGESDFLSCESYWLALALNDSSRKISRNRVKASQ